MKTAAAIAGIANFAVSARTRFIVGPPAVGRFGSRGSRPRRRGRRRDSLLRRVRRRRRDAGGTSRLRAPTWRPWEPWLIHRRRGGGAPPSNERVNPRGAAGLRRFDHSKGLVGEALRRPAHRTPYVRNASPTGIPSASFWRTRLSSATFASAWAIASSATAAGTTTTPS